MPSGVAGGQFASAALIAVLAGVGCQGARPPASQFPSAAAALARMKETFQCERGVHGDAKVDHYSNVGRVRGKALLYAVRPQSLRIDVVGPPPFNSIFATLTSDGQQFALADFRRKEFLHGAATACNVARLTQVSLPPHVLVSLLGGRAPLLVHDDARLEMEWSSRGYYIIRIPSTQGADEEVHLSPSPADWGKPWQEQRVRVLEVAVNQRGVELYRAELGDHAWAKTAAPFVDPDGIDPPIPPSGPWCTAELPRTLRLEALAGDQDLSFRYESVELNPPLPAGVFTQPSPPGMEPVFVECR
jgi:hypothetical protein